MNEIYIPTRKAARYLEMVHKPGYKIYPLVNEAFYKTYNFYKMFDGVEKSEIIKKEHNWFNFLVKEKDGKCYYYVFKEAGTDFANYKAIAKFHNLSGGKEYRVVVFMEDSAITLTLETMFWENFNCWYKLEKEPNETVVSKLEYCCKYQGKELSVTKKKPSARMNNVYKWVKRNPGKTNYPKKWTMKEINYANLLINSKNVRPLDPSDVLYDLPYGV